MLSMVPMILSLCMLLATPLHAAITLKGNGATDSVTFTGNNVLPYTLNITDTLTTLYMGRNDPSLPVGTDSEAASYAISVAPGNGSTRVLPYAPFNVRLNGVDNQINPLSGQKILLLGMYRNTPFAVTADTPSSLYWIASSQGVTPFDVLSISQVLDASGAVNADGAVTAGILAGCASTNYMFAAVKPNGGAFGVAGSGIGMFTQNGINLTQLPAVTGDTGIKSVPLNNTSATVVIGVANAAINGAILDTYFDPILQRLYIVYEVANTAGVPAGARGVVMGYVNPTIRVTPSGTRVAENKLVLTDFVPATAFNPLGDINHVVGFVGVTTLSLSKVRTMYTSTGLTYAILVGDVITTGTPTTRVWAVPLVNKSVDPANKNTWLTDPLNGVLASSVVNPGTNLVTYFSPVPSGQINCYYGRGFQVPATTTADLPLNTTTPVQVGVGVAPGAIQNIQVVKDTVFVATAASVTMAAGIFASQAIFDSNAAIVSWTPWQRVAYSGSATTSIYGFGWQPTYGFLFTMEGASNATVNTIKTTSWSNHDEDGLLGGTTTDSAVGFINQINPLFPSQKGGIQGMFDFPLNTNGFTTAIPGRLSAMIFTGYKQIVLVQTGADTGGGVFTPQVGDFSTGSKTYTGGAITAVPAANTALISVSGGALDTIGAITSAVVVNDTIANAYIVVAGVGGVAVLRPTFPNTGLTEYFQNLPVSAFTLIGNYTNVRKLLSDNAGNLYVLTNTTFDSVPAIQLTGAITPTVLATPTTMGLTSTGNFSDVVVSNKLALLATSQGLFRTGNGANISTAATPAAVAWTQVTLPESQVAVTRLLPLSTTGLPQDFSNAAGGQVYVLAGSITYNLTNIYRCAVTDTNAAAVANTTVQVVPDYFIESTKSPFSAIGAYRNYFRTDGALLTDSRSQYISNPAQFDVLPVQLRTGSMTIPRRTNSLASLVVTGCTTVGSFLRNSGLGSLILPTNQGMQVLE